MHHHGLNGTHRNTKPLHTHSPMAGALLQTSTICCSSKAKSDGQVICSDGRLTTGLYRYQLTAFTDVVPPLYVQDCEFIYFNSSENDLNTKLVISFGRI